MTDGQLPNDLTVCRYCERWDNGEPFASKWWSKVAVGWCGQHELKTMGTSACADHTPTRVGVQIATRRRDGNVER